jgi:nucleotide-binding universal stress UspA family protein
MGNELLHVFRNTPFGRETLMQSAFFCKRIGLAMEIYLPRHPQFLMYFEHGVVTVDLDRAFLRSPETAREHASEIADAFSIPYGFFEPTRFMVPDLPDLSVNYDYMCCPRSISDLSSKIGLGHIGSRVRSIVQKAGFPVLIPAAAFKEWNSIVCFFGGSANASVALRCARHLSERSAAPMRIFTQAEKTREFYRDRLEAASVLQDIAADRTEWLYFEGGDLRENLYAVPHDALVVIGAYGHGVARDLLFGSKMEMIQTVLPNPLLIVGPDCRV